mmetsp:Transcript_3261/g.3600  ORF Transcript_3261/g.3600 Transcript_3261/m.3600 type:complete len:89 (+) Transcript_3261:450-716(+)
MVTTSTQYDNDEVTVCAAVGIYFTHDDDIVLALILLFAFSWVGTSLFTMKEILLVVEVVSAWRDEQGGSSFTQIGIYRRLIYNKILCL